MQESHPENPSSRNLKSSLPILEPDLSVRHVEPTDPEGPEKRVYIYSNGCIENQLDDVRFQKFFKNNKWKAVDDYRDSDLILFNTCAFNRKMEDDSIETIQEFQKKSDATLVVAGCLPKINQKRMRDVFTGDFFSPRTMHKLNTIAEAKVPIEDVTVNRIENVLHRSSSGLALLYARVLDLVATVDNRFGSDLISLTRRFGVTWYHKKMFFLDISAGCLSNCSFCAIKRAQGSVKSRSIEEIRQEFKRGLAGGFREFVLSSVDCGSYGRDLGVDLVTLLREMLAEPGNYRLHIRYVEPERLIEIFDDLASLLPQTRKIASVTSSIQSGSDRILEAMNKKIKIDEWVGCIEAMNRRFPEISFRTQIIVGFPGETEADFSDTLRLFDDLDIDSAGVYEYSVRPGTRASRLTDDVPASIKRSRRKRVLRKLMARRVRRIFSKRDVQPVAKSALPI